MSGVFIMSNAELSRNDLASIQVGFSPNTFKTNKIQGLENISCLELFSLLRECRQGGKDGAFFTRSAFIDPSAGHKTNDSIEPLSQVLIIDGDSSVDLETEEVTDGAPDPNLAAKVLTAFGWNFLLYTSHSHGSEKGNRYRIILPTDRPYNAIERDATLEDIFRELHEAGLNIKNVDENKNHSLGWYLPRRDDPDDGEFICIENNNGGAVIIADEEHIEAMTAKTERELAQEKITHKEHLPDGRLSPIYAYNEQFNVTEELIKRGDNQVGERFMYHDSGSGAAGIHVDYDNNKIFSHHGTDPLGDGYWHGAFDVMMDREGFTESAAVAYAAEHTDAGKGQTVSEFNKAIQDQKPIKGINCLSDLLKFKVDKATLDKMSAPEWVYVNLIILGHLITIVAPPNGGKTTLMMWICSQIAATMNVLYINADTAGTDAAAYNKQAEENGFQLLLPDMHAGMSMQNVVETLEGMNNNETEDYSNTLIVLDTLKKMTDVINKAALKKLLITLRGLTAKGMTIICLGHTNKYKDGDGNYVYEGTGDIRSDTDELIYLIPQKHDNGSMTISTQPDKVRGQFEAITFEISSDRKVQQKSEYINVKHENEWLEQYEKDNSIIQAINEAIDNSHVVQLDIKKQCKEKYSISFKSTKRVLDYFIRGHKKLWNRNISSAHNALIYSRVGVDTANLGDKLDSDEWAERDKTVMNTLFTKSAPPE